MNGGRRVFMLHSVAAVDLVEQSVHRHADGSRHRLGALGTQLHQSAAGTGPAYH